MVVLGTVVPFSVRLIFVTTRQNGGVAVIMGLLSALVLLAGVLILRGLTPVSPGHGRIPASARLDDMHRAGLRSLAGCWRPPQLRRGSRLTA
jgi:hypothetical protein